jgi:hypothetical protein
MRNRGIIKIRIPIGWTAAMMGIVVFLTSGALLALKGQELLVETNSGPAVVKLNDQTVIRGELPIKFSDITAKRCRKYSL